MLIGLRFHPHACLIEGTVLIPYRVTINLEHEQH
ncbi:MAG: hypothetical protein RL585_1937 [Pseudomonadota bacterium]